MRETPAAETAEATAEKMINGESVTGPEQGPSNDYMSTHANG